MPGPARPPMMPLGPITEAARQTVLDAAAPLQVQRTLLSAQLTHGPVRGAEIIAYGDEINYWLVEQLPTWRELLSVRSTATVAQLRVSVPNNRRFIAGGLEMVSLFDYHGTEPAGRTLLTNETLGTYLFGVCPIQLKMADRRFVLLQGPEVDGAWTVMKVSTPACMDAAWRYWQAVIGSVVPVKVPAGEATLTPRQRQVVDLLAADLGDEAIAATLGVSVRTVRSDIAAVLESVGARSRFAAAARLHLDDQS